MDMGIHIERRGLGMPAHSNKTHTHEDINTHTYVHALSYIHMYTYIVRIIDR